MVDIGRKHICYEWLADHVRELAYLKMNYLHLHFTEDLGWRIESEQHPEIVSVQHLTKQQVRDLVELAGRYHITVVPEIDIPGHMGAALSAHPELQLKDLQGVAAPGKLDYTLPEARQFARELIEEYLPLFPGPYWHTGADEFVPAAQSSQYPQLESYAKDTYGSTATFKDGLLGFVNEINELVRGHGKTLRVWHDGLGGGQIVSADPDIVVEWWTDFLPDVPQLPTPQSLLDEGRLIQNAGWVPTYYSPSIPLPLPGLADMYESWAVHRFGGLLVLFGSPFIDIDPTEPQNLGATLHVWNDDPTLETEDEIAAGIFPRLRIIAQKTWESPGLVPTYEEFAPIVDRIGSAP
jgi:hexosaminidase